MSKTAREVIESFQITRVVGQAGEHQFRLVHEFNELVATLDAAGFVIVPKEPDDTMTAAGGKAGAWYDNDGQIVGREYDEHGRRNAAAVYCAMMGSWRSREDSNLRPAR